MIGAELEPTSARATALPVWDFTFTKVDIVIHFTRMPRGEWLLIDAQTETAGNGLGIASSAFSDGDGVYARGHQALFISPRGGRRRSRQPGLNSSRPVRSSGYSMRIATRVWPGKRALVSLLRNSARSADPCGGSHHNAPNCRAEFPPVARPRPRRRSARALGRREAWPLPRRACALHSPRLAILRATPRLARCRRTGIIGRRQAVDVVPRQPFPYVVQRIARRRHWPDCSLASLSAL